MKPIFVLLGLLAIFPLITQAQSRGMATGARAIPVAPTVVHSNGAAHTPAARGPVFIAAHPAVRTSNVVHVRSAEGAVRVIRRPPVASRPMHRNVIVVEDEFEDDFPVPGLGFDFAHFAVTHPNVFKHRHSPVGSFFPVFNGGFVIPSVPAVVEEETAPVDEADEVEPAPRRVVVHTPAPQPPSAIVVAPEQTPVQPSEEFVFVRRDGTVFFAVGYSWENGSLRYITNQGIRGTLTQDALDLPATRQFNEQRGLNFHL